MDDRLAAYQTTHGPRDRMRIALTFDDGPWPTTTAVLKALAQQCTKATFFMVGRMAATDPAMVREVADNLRARGLDVIEEGRREPAKDNPVGIALGHLLKWLANPADAFAWEVVEMSPLAATRAREIPCRLSTAKASSAA
mgnify:CR=1 FL=1